MGTHNQSDLFESLSFCGIYCGTCGNFKKNLNCMGCRIEKEQLNDCPTLSCGKERGLLHCGECEDFPCPMLSDFYNDGRDSHRKAYESMLEIREIGAEAWLQKKQNEISGN